MTASTTLSAWDEVFPDQAMTVAPVDRLVLHSTILELNVDSDRRRPAPEPATGQKQKGTRRAPVLTAEELNRLGNMQLAPGSRARVPDKLLDRLGISRNDLGGPRGIV